MTDNTQPEAREFTMSQYASKDDMIGAMRKRIAELESQLEAIGAGGVSGPLMGRAAPPTAQAEGWRPIETAPKDGQAILVTDGWCCYCVEWDEEFDWWTVDDNKLGPFRLRGSAPTHWMPLPAAPGPADGESK